VWEALKGDLTSYLIPTSPPVDKIRNEYKRKKIKNGKKGKPGKKANRKSLINK
jgi:hypothetical protein